MLITLDNMLIIIMAPARNFIERYWQRIQLEIPWSGIISKRVKQFLLIVSL
jgi:hypothetical protein